MAVSKRRLELNCIICSQPLASLQTCLPQDVLQMVADQNNTPIKRKTDHIEFNYHADIDQHQSIATKCGHMFHMGCLRNHIKTFVERAGTAPCPICSKPVTLTRVWPVLVPPTPAQLYRMKKLNFMKKESSELKVEIAEIRKKVKACEAELKTIEDETESCLADIQIKQQQLDDLNAPSEAELEELRRIHKNRQAIVRVVTKHNADLLGVLMHETNLQISDTDVALSDQETEVNHNHQQNESNHLYDNSFPTRRNHSRSKTRTKDKKRERYRYREQFHNHNSRDPSDQNSESDSDQLNCLSSTSFSQNNGRFLTPFAPPSPKNRNGNLRHRRQGLGWKSSSAKQNFVNPTTSEIRSLAVNRTTKAGGMGIGNYARAAIDRGIIGRMPISGGPDGTRGLVLTRKEGTRELAKDDEYGTNSFVHRAGTRRPLILAQKNNMNNNQNKVSRSFRPKWC